MSGLVCIFNRNNEPVSDNLLTKMMSVRPERGPDGNSTSLNGPAGIGFQHFCLLPEERGENQPLETDRLMLAADCRLDNRFELARQLGVNNEQLLKTSDAALVLMAYEHWGERCPERLLGDFVFILWDKVKRCLFAARDALGMRGLCYYVDASVCLLGSEISQLLIHPAITPSINENRVAALLSFLPARQPESYYQSIYYLPPAHALTVTADDVKLHTYWEFQPGTIRYRDDRQYADHYRELLTEAVRCRLRSVGPIGITMSGGLDSTTIASLAGSMLPTATGQARLKSFSYAFDELESCDERVFIRPVVERVGLDATYILCDDQWPLKNLPAWPTTPDMVMADIYALLPAAVMQSAGQAGVRLLLGGYFGDVLMTGQNFWALDMMRERQFGLMARTVKANKKSVNWWESFVDYGIRRFIRPEMARSYRRFRPRQSISVSPGINEDLVIRTDLRRRMTPEPQQTSLRAPGLLQRYNSMVSSNFSQGFAATRYQYNREGLELALPYYDRRLVEFVLSIPAYVIGRPGHDRGLHREAVAGLLPEEVRLRQNPTNFIPLMMKGLKEKEKDTIQQIMSNPQVVERGFIRADWLATQLQRKFDLSQDSILLWSATSLELWLQRYWS